MQNKFEGFNNLPAELRIETAQNLSNRDLVSLAQTSKYHLALFKPLVDVRKLLLYVVLGKHDAVQLILIDGISLMLKRGKVADCYGREFENISSFEYALWAMDKHMWGKMMSCIPQNKESSEVYAELIAQYNKVKTKGVTYRLNGKTITEQHFDFKNTLIKELQTQVDSISAPGLKNWGAIDNQWREGVGGAQKRLPMHIVDEYLSKVPFFPVPKFTEQPKLSKPLYNWTTNIQEDCFILDSKLGSEFAISKAGGPAHRACQCAPRTDYAAADDLRAMEALCKVRTLDLINLKSQLEKQGGLENHYQVVPL